MKTILAFYATAVADLEDAKTLIEKPSFASAISYLQQSVEKLSKAYSLIEGVIPFDKFKSKVGHQPHKIFRKQSENFKVEVSKVILLEKHYPEFLNSNMNEKSIDWKKYQKEITKEIVKAQHLDPWEFHELSHFDIDFILEEARKLEATKIEIDEEVFLNQAPEILISYLNNIKKYNPTEIGNFITNLEHPEFAKKIGLLCLYHVKSIPDGLFLTYSLFILSLITASHQETTRYPCGDCGFNPREYYIEGLGIVDKLPELLEWQTDVLATFSKLYLEIPQELESLMET